MKKGISIGIIALFIVSAVSPMVIGFKSDAVKSERDEFRDLTPYLVNIGNGNHPPIIIDGNDDFTSENGVTGGSGIEEDPYIIEDWVILGDGSDGKGIFIKNTDAYFVIRNCIVSHFSGNYGRGIVLSNVQNGRIESSITYENYLGIWVLKNSSYIYIVNCSSGNYSINWAKSIRCDNSKYISIISSECHDSDYGILLNETSYVIIENSSFYNNYWYGIWGIGNYRYSIHNYTINGCKIYNNSHDGIDIHSRYIDIFRTHSGHIHITNCEIYDNGIPELKPQRYSGLSIAGLHDTIIENCTIYHNGEGIVLGSCTNNIIKNCSIFNHISSHSSGIFAAGIQIHGNGFTLGYKMRGSHNEITNCEIFDNEMGLFLVRSKTLVQKNNIFNNSVQGIHTVYFDMSHINYNNIYGNGFHENSDGTVMVTISFADLRNNWWGSLDGPKIGHYKDIFPLFGIVRFMPWATEPIPDAGVQ